MRVFALIGVMAVAVLAGAARAGTVLIERHPIDETSLVCGGAVTQTTTGTVISIAQFDDDGNLLSVANVFADHKTTFTNPTTGVSVTSVRGALERRVIDEDGSFTRMSAGLFGEFVLRGTGLVAVNTGLLVVSFDPFGNVTDIQVTPTRDGRITNFICPYLT